MDHPSVLVRRRSLFDWAHAVRDGRAVQERVRPPTVRMLLLERVCGRGTEDGARTSGDEVRM
jgi:hypothetical protein